ncbi:MAG: bifunctional glycosyltransferase family 2/GtrA family protein [Syntrophomonadaceae bacterium]|nr:bifunctional glycosyltransferase family 2/GtrA family protein [Syntrophomonadaceae bacterium]
MKILIPAYEPGEKMLNLIAHLKMRTNDVVVVVDDGSGPDYDHIFYAAEQLGCVVLHHPFNLGKGAALKTGFRYIAAHGETEGVVCADCDGQHTVADILNVAAVTRTWDTHIVLGVREFVGKVPWRSRWGNTLTRSVFAWATGYSINDTQTGLRGYPAGMLGWLSGVPGNRFEYELNILIQAGRDGYPICQIPIATVYDDNNRSSHFHPIIDSVRVYLPIVKFSGSSIIAAVLDFIMLLFLQAKTGNLLASVVGARACSSLCNYMFNKYFVFNRKSNENRHSFFRYYTLVLAILGCNYLLLSVFANLLGLPLAAAKVITEAVLFLASYWVQKRFIFSPLNIRTLLNRRLTAPKES